MSTRIDLEDWVDIDRRHVVLYLGERLEIRRTMTGDKLEQLAAAIDAASQQNQKSGLIYCHGRFVRQLSIDVMRPWGPQIHSFTTVFTLWFAPLSPEFPNCKYAPFERPSFLRDALEGIDIDKDYMDAMMYALGGIMSRIITGYDPGGQVKSTSQKEVEDDALYFMIQSMQKEIEAEDYEAAAASKRDIEKYIQEAIDIEGLKP